jgi:hypothetical protein
MCHESSTTCHAVHYPSKQSLAAPIAPPIFSLPPLSTQAQIIHSKFQSLTSYKLYIVIYTRVAVQAYEAYDEAGWTFHAFGTNILNGGRDLVTHGCIHNLTAWTCISRKNVQILREFELLFINWVTSLQLCIVLPDDSCYFRTGFTMALQQHIWFKPSWSSSKPW